VQNSAIIETVAEVILSSSKPLTVVDDAGKAVGTITAAKIVHVLFGSHSTQRSENAS
jgi:CBS-domain-containing membrane protein